MDLGSRIKEVRSRKQLTLRELAKRIGLTDAFLSQVERNLASPSIGSLKKIADALNVKVGYLFEEEEQKELVFIRKKERKKLVHEEPQVSYEILASGMLNVKMEPLLLTLEVGGKTDKYLSSHRGEEFGIVLKGKVELLLDKKRYRMEEGDSIYFRNTKPHKVINVGQTKATVLWTIFSSPL